MRSAQRGQLNAQIRVLVARNMLEGKRGVGGPAFGVGQGRIDGCDERIVATISGRVDAILNLNDVRKSLFLPSPTRGRAAPTWRKVPAPVSV